jgi:hypothetical protein
VLPVIYFAQLRNPEHLSSYCRFQCEMMNDRSVGSPSRQSADRFREARVVRITLGGFAIWLDPFGMLDPQIAVNLLLKVRCTCELDEIWQSASVKDLRSARERYPRKGWARTADGHRCRKRAPRPGEGTPKGGAHLVALCTTAGQLAYFVALALQQHGQQSALCKGQG